MSIEEIVALIAFSVIALPLLVISIGGSIWIVKEFFKE